LLHRNIAILHICTPKHPTTHKFSETRILRLEIWWNWYVGWRPWGYVMGSDY